MGIPILEPAQSDRRVGMNSSDSSALGMSLEAAIRLLPILFAVLPDILEKK